jgi:hypothetical protein
MARFVSGEVVVVPFPFTDLSSAKVRPAVVLASLTSRRSGSLPNHQPTSPARDGPWEGCIQPSSTTFESAFAPSSARIESRELNPFLTNNGTGVSQNRGCQ